MARQRPQVRELETGSLVVQPTARPVDTYVRPAALPAETTPLAQFVNAIAPAVQAVGDKQKAELLKREREIETQRLKAKYNEADRKVWAIDTQTNAHYDANADVWHQMSTEEAISQYSRPQEEYLKTLEDSGFDPVLVSSMKDAFITSRVKFTAKFDAGKAAYNVNQQDKKFTDDLALALSMSRDREDVAATINTLIDSNAEGYSKADGTPNFKRFTDLAHDYLFNMSVDNADNALYDALSTRPVNVMDTSDHIKNSSTIRARRDAEILTKQKAVNKANQLSTGIDDAITSGGAMPTEYTKLDGTTGTISVAEQTSALYADPTFQSTFDSNGQPTAETFQLFGRLRFVPEEIKNKISNPFTLFEAGQDVNTPETNAQLQDQFFLYNLAKNSGVNLEEVVGLSKEQTKLMDLVDFLVYEKAQVGTLQFTDENGITRTAPNFNNVAKQIQNAGDRLDMPPPSKLTENVEELAKPLWLNIFATDITDADNSGVIIAEAADAAHKLMILDPSLSEQNAMRDALSIVKKDYALVSDGAGGQYHFKALNTDIDIALDPSSTISEYNELLNQSNAVVQSVGEATGLQQGEFLVRLSPDFGNPNSISMRVYDTREGRKDFVYNFSTGFDKRSLLSDPQQLNNLVATIATQEDYAVLDSYYDGFEFDDFGVPVPTVGYFGGTREGQAEVGFFETPFVQDLVSSLSQTETEWFMKLDETLAKATEGSQVLQWLDKNPPLFDTEDNQSIVNRIGEFVGGLLFKSPDEALPPSIQKIQDGIRELSIEGEPTGFMEQPPSGTVEEPTRLEPSEALDKVQEMIGQLNPIKSATASTIIEDEGFSATPYDDMGKQSVGHGLQIESLEPDERALIKDINNVQPEESQAVVALKVDKISNYFDDVVDGFQNLPETAQSAMVQMGYQLGQYNVTKDWPEFMKSMKEAAKYAEGSVEQAVALANAQFNMLNTVRKDGTIKATKWATQTADRAMKVASELGASIKEAVIPTAEASTLTPEQQVKEEENTLKKVFDTIYKLDVTPANATQLIKNTLFGDTEVDLLDLNPSDLSLLKGLVKDKLATGTTKISYEDFDTTGQGSIKKGLLETIKLSATSPEYRMATLLGASSIKVEGDKVYIVDTYDFNKGTKGASFKNFVEKGEFTKAYKVLEDVPFTEKLRIIAYMTQPETAVKGGVKIYVGDKKDLT